MAEPAQYVAIVVASETITAGNHGIDRGAHSVLILGSGEVA
jgi:hypothetical protein